MKNKFLVDSLRRRTWWPGRPGPIGSRESQVSGPASTKNQVRTHRVTHARPARHGQRVGRLRFGAAGDGAKREYVSCGRVRRSFGVR